MNSNKLTPEQEAYFASVKHLNKYFEINSVKPFGLLPKTAAIVDSLLSQHDIPAKLKNDLYWIFGYIRIQYTINFNSQKKKWEEEQKLYRNKAVKDAVDLYFNILYRLPFWEFVESITFKVKKPDFLIKEAPKDEEAFILTYNLLRQHSQLKPNGAEETLKITYPPMIRFILEAIITKRNNEHELINKDAFFKEERRRIEEFEILQKVKEDTYEAIRKKETIEGLYNYLFDNTQLGTQALCRFGAELMFEAGVPFNTRETRSGKRVVEGVYDVFCDEITQLFKKYAPIRQRNPVSDKSSNLRTLIERRKKRDNQQEL